LSPRRAGDTEPSRLPHISLAKRTASSRNPVLIEASPARRLIGGLSQPGSPISRPRRQQSLRTGTRRRPASPRPREINHPGRPGPGSGSPRRLGLAPGRGRPVVRTPHRGRPSTRPPHRGRPLVRTPHRGRPLARLPGL